ncbi:MAG: LON peptidase substrate-binding domain-containing protein [Candidatus Paracaedibacteraceae bacterium]|nr:LON peptidase substrate-binding domain-containing protein [Candidatus Paracaedibacteraceae bacterium]
MGIRGSRILYKAMADSSQPISIHNLPRQILLFMVRGAILLPKAKLPLPIFDSSHVSMISDCLTGNRLLGLVQPSASLRMGVDLDDLSVFQIGCLAKVIDVTEPEEGKLVAELEGVARFRLLDQTTGADGYPLATVDYASFASDLIDEIDFTMDRPRLYKALKPYFDRLDISPNWDEINKTSNHRLLTALSMACPLPPSEKQALLEVESIQEQSHVMTALIEMAAFDRQPDHVIYH